MAAEETALTGVGELLFSLLIGYLGALEFAFVARHLYHWTFQHPGDSSVDAAADAEELPRMRERLDKQIKEAAEREALAGTNVMQDGVLYVNGIRVDPAGDKRQALAAELARQQQIEADTRRQLAEAEAKLVEERLRVQREKEESEEQQRKLVEAERQREREQAEKELQEQREAERRQLEAEENQRKQRENEEKERLENERRLIDAEREREENERRLQEAEEQREREESERRIVVAERQREQAEAEKERAEQQRILAEAEAAQAERRLFDAEIQRERDQADEEGQALRDAEIVERLLAAERELSPSATESELEEDAAIAEQSRRLISSRTDLEQKQRMIEENARRFLEAEEEMVMLQQRQLQASHSKEEADEYAGMEPVVEELCVKKVAPPRFQEPPEEPMVHKVKTQFGQGSGPEDAYSAKSKTLTFPGVSDEGSSLEPKTPFSIQQSSFSTQPSDEGNRIESERPEPEGEDQIQEVQYTEDYLRSLDGIKNRPLMREDGSGRRRAFKKRRSSGSSNSSRESRASRDEELKMFTSLEEEELRHGDREDYNPIKYTSEPTLRVKSHRRHKRSPAKDVRPTAESTTSLEMLGEESTNPWGEVVPEHYKDTEFWKREKALSIDEEEIELERPSRGEDVEEEATNEPKSSSFEEATEAQNEQAVAALKQQLSKEQLDKEAEKDNPQAVDTSDSNKSNLIFSGEYTKAMDKDWHSGHFCCWQCDESLTGQRYVIRDDHPYCIKCYENVFANTCEECNKIIGIDSKDLSYKDKHWHEACFLCFKCHLSLVDKQFGAKADKIYCGNCYDAQFASRCDGCGEVFRAGTKKMEYKTRQWHENCFCCCVCKTAIGTKSFIPREQEIYCAGCYEEKFATRCIKCNKVITSGGVTYKNEPWHRECFTCTHCNITLAGQRFTSRDEKPYCAECFGELFAKRCTACVKPITGIGGTRFISFEDRHWHHDCFVCASCKASLVGRGFITDGPDILCPDCAKQKLM
uniref:Limpet, isoform J n=1 Tax=Drosophila melanogaster TaxID=7227 RepID=M9MRX0_DROME|nr:limpet, isoform J [Drosophila melanogaster]ADV37558.1 limpet, isoform J [Drosophila melanogaster]|eukprot:NP_001189122.1 limpet, isoform J [Drosophila melanogaster]